MQFDVVNANCNFRLFKKTQLEKNQVRAVNTSQQRQLADKDNEVAEEPNPEDETSSKCVVIFSPAEDKTLRETAMKFTYMKYLWICNPHTTMTLPLDDKYVAKERFKTPQSQAQGIVRDLYDAFPRKHHKALLDDVLFRKFVSFSHRLKATPLAILTMLPVNQTYEPVPLQWC